MFDPSTIPQTVHMLAAIMVTGFGTAAVYAAPVKLAAMEALCETSTQVPLSIGGIYVDNQLRYSLDFPYGLSLLVTHDPNGQVTGLESVPP